MLTTCAAFAQQDAEDPDATANARPRIGLVLGGGGARGAAHIGVLRELERMRIPIDAIAGTSMGAAVGGLYASGMSVDELDAVVENMDWADVLSDTPPRRDLDYRRKQDDARYPINVELGVADGELKLPLGLVQGQKLDLVLRELTLDVSSIDDFDDLPVPFRAVASDIERGEIHVMDSGDLALAIRASMSVPAALAPVQVDGRMLVDGGLVGNLPIEVMRAMDVDVIIAVDVEFPLYSIDELGSAIAVTEQMLTILIRKETQRQIESLAAGDVLIRPDLGKLGSTEFERVSEAIEPGAEATRAVADKLAPLSMDADGYADWQARRTTVIVPPATLDFVRVESDSRIRSSVLASRVGVSAGDAVDAEALREGAERLYGTRLFGKVGYRLVDEGSGTGAEYTAMERAWGSSYLRFGITLDDDFEGTTNFDLRARLTRPAINSLGGEWRSDLQLGTNPLVATEFYQPLRFDSLFFASPYAVFDQSNLNLFESESVVARLRISEFTAGVDLGAEFGNAGELRLGAYRGSGTSRTTIGDLAIPDTDFETGGLRTLLRFDTLDNAWFPRRGLRASLEWRQSLPSFGADDNYDIVDTSIDYYRSRGRTTLGLGIDYATTLSDDAAVQDLFRLGGFRNLSGFERGAISGPHAAVARLTLQRRIGDSPGSLFEAPVYLGATLEAGNTWQTRSQMSFDTALLHGSLFLGMDSFIGPVFLAAGFGEGGRSNFYLYVGSPPGQQPTF